MSERRTKASGRPVLLVGDGRRPRELGAVLSALATVRAEDEGGEGVDAVRPLGFDDLEDLLTQRPGDGTLILDCERVPTEDIGFIRRFLERHPAWSLLLVGPEGGDERAKRLLTLPRARWMPWPPDLDQLGAWISESWNHASASADEARPATQRRRPARTRDPAAEEAPAAAEGTDLGTLVEELLASASVDGGEARYLYSCDEAVWLDADASALRAGLAGLLGLARRCAGSGGVVSAKVDAEGGAARVLIDFPLGPLTDGDLPGLLEKPFEGDESLAQDVAEARHAVEALGGLAGSVELQAQRQGRLRLEVRLPRSEAGRATPERRAPAQRAANEAGSPRNPFG